MNRARNQFLSGAGFSLDKNGGIRRRDAFDLFQHSFQSGTATDDLLESARITVLVTGPKSFESSHRGPPCVRVPASVLDQLSKAARTLSSTTSSSNGFAMTSTAPARNACIRIFSSPSPVMHIVALLQSP